MLRLLARRLRGPLVAAATAVVVASLGYWLIEGWGLLDAVFMSVITMGQVGYGEVHPLHTSGRIWTIVVIVSGFAVFVYTAAALTAVFVSGDIAAAVRERRRERMRERLQQHVVVVGFGRVGRASAEAAVRAGRSCVVIDTGAEREPSVAEIGANFLLGDARDVTVLREAGAQRAAAIITSLDDPSNAVVALTARSLSPSVRIVARVTDSAWSDRLMRAGASHVVPVYESVGTSMAATALDAEVVGVLAVPGTDMRVEEMEVAPGSKAEGHHLRAVMNAAPDAHVLGVKLTEGMRRWHEADEPLRAGDMVVVMGNAAAISSVAAMVRREITTA